MTRPMTISSTRTHEARRGAEGWHSVLPVNHSGEGVPPRIDRTGDPSPSTLRARPGEERLSFRITAADRVTLNWLRTLAHLRSQVAEFRRQLLSRLKPIGVEWAVECNEYESGLVLTVYVDADLGDGRSLVWWLDVTHDGEQWHLDPRVTWNGQDPI